jgi:hypothetical protein
MHDKATAYAVFDGHTQNDGATYVYKTTDFGKTWTSLAKDNLYGFARSIQEDRVNSDLLFLGTEFGLFVTFDGGQQWHRFTNNMPATAVHYIEMHPRTDDLIMGTHGRGILIIDDISPLRELTPKVLEKSVHFFKSKPTIIREESGFGGASTETQFVGDNPDKNAKIVYYLKTRHIFGKMTLEVFNDEGQKVADLSPKKAKGINIVSWDYHLKPPKIAKGKTFAFSGFSAPRVPAGIYKVVLTKGKESYQTTIELKNDPRSQLSKRERRQLHQTTMKLYDMTQQLAYLVYQIDELANRLEKQELESLKTFNSELQTLKESLVITTGDNYVSSGEPQLREKLADLYAKVAQGFTPPTSAELRNLALLESEFEQAKVSFSKLQEKYLPKLTEIEKTNGVSYKIRSFEEFIED